MPEHFNPIDVLELEEWRESIDDVINRHGMSGAKSVVEHVISHAKCSGELALSVAKSYLNTYDAVYDRAAPQGMSLGDRAEKVILWNAMAMVVKANLRHGELGGHLSTFASSSVLYRIGFDYFFKGNDDGQGDLIYFQGHASPGIYARSYLEGHLSEDRLALFRQEAKDPNGLSSYPHPWLMPDYWQFPTVSMGLGPLQAVYQAHWQRYLTNRGLSDNQRLVWAFCGDGEMDEPESTAALQMASREQLDNCIFVVNCNLQRLDGPVRGNSKVITELENLFDACGWRVIKVLWGSGWDKLWALDTNGELQAELAKIVDGQYLSLAAKGPKALLDYLSQQSPSIKAVCAQLSQHEIEQLQPGGHDPIKVYTAYKHAVEPTGKPTVILAHTIKGHQLGASTHSRNIAHNKKKMTAEDLHDYAKWCGVSLAKEAIEKVSFYHPGSESDVCQFIKERRTELGGYVPKRHPSQKKLSALNSAIWSGLRESTGDKQSSTTMAFVRMLNTMLRDDGVKEYIVPIVADEARTFGMEGLFKKIGIYASSGQLYQPEDQKSIMGYTERKNGQLLQEGLTEAGALSAWIAAATSYATSDQPMLPMYIFYSMFGFQRVGDLLWLAGDIRARGFLFGATAGRTTLGGEGLQHNDGNSHVMAALVPNCISYDPCFQYEIATIMADGVRRMGADCEDVFYYITLMNENYSHPEMPQGVENDIVKGMYALPKQDDQPEIQLLGSGAILREVIQAAEQLRQLGVKVCVYSVTSFTELARQAQAMKREEVLTGTKQSPHVEKMLDPAIPVLAATDYVRAYAEQIRPYIESDYEVLGTDGFGRSDSRQNLRRFFGVNADYIVYHSIWQLVRNGHAKQQLLKELREKIDTDIVSRDPTKV